MDLLRNEVINEHYRLIQQLEHTYTQQINDLLKQKAFVHLALQQKLYSKLLEINTLTELTSNGSNTPSLQQPPHYQPPSHDPHSAASTDPSNPVLTSGNLQSILAILQQLDPNMSTNDSSTTKNASSVSSLSNASISAPAPPTQPIPNTSDTGSHPLLKCEICNVAFQKKANYNFHLSMHQLQNAMFSQFPENYMDHQHNNNEIKSQKNVHDVNRNGADKMDTNAIPNHGYTTANILGAAEIKQEAVVNQPLYTPNQRQRECERDTREHGQPGTSGTVCTPDPPSLSISSLGTSATNSAAHLSPDIAEDHFNGISVKIKPFHCAKCGKYFRQKRELNRHIINKHTPNHEKPFKCRFCKYGAATKSIVQRHEYTHSTNKPYKCSQCNYQTSYRYILKKHINKVHNGKGNEVVNEVKVDRNHVIPSLTPNTWKCRYCNARFASKYLMNQHETVHGGAESTNNYKCDQCSFQCAHKHSLIGHKLMHNQNKPFLCNICHKKFTTITELEQHAQQNH